MEDRKHRANPAGVGGPLRLEWPGGGSSRSIGRQATLVSSQASSEGSRGKRKRKRKRQKVADTSLWNDKYAPTSAAQLCVAPKKVKEVRAWLTDPSSSRLMVLVGSPGIGKSTVIKVLASELGWTVHEWNDSSSSQHYTGRGDSLTSVDRSNALESFQEFLDRSGAGFLPLQLSLGVEEARPASNDDGNAVILIDELPNLRNVDVEAEFREIMSRHIQRSNVPTVLIFSDVREGKHQPRDLERLIDPQYLYNSELVTIRQCNPVTKARMKKSLEAISKKEGIQVPAHFWEEVHMQSGGDLRHAIMALQFRGNDNDDVGGGDKKHHYERDSKLSMFHTLGKVLYAKRKKVPEVTNSNERPPLDFNPDAVMEQSGMDLGAALTFLGYHSPDFFTDVSEISKAFDHYSDAAVLLGRSVQRDYSDSVFPGGYVGSIAGRAVADANRHPAPNSFRSLSAPKICEVTRNQRANEVTMEQLCKRLSVASDRMPLDANLGKCRTFVTDRLPFMRSIVPGDVDYAMNNLYSHVRSSENKEAKVKSENALRLEEQAKILEMDDIVEDDDDDDDDSSLDAGFADEMAENDERHAKRMKPSSPARKDPRKVSLSPIIID